MAQFDYIEFDTTPVDEPCVGVSRTEDYMPAMREEAKRYKAMLEAKFPDAPGFFSIKSMEHDFGTYLEIRYNFAEDTGWDYANHIESNLPAKWSDTDPCPLVKAA